MARRRSGVSFSLILAKIGEDATEAAKKKLEEGAELIVKDAQSRVNIGPLIKGHTPGLLKSAIKWQWKGKRIVISSTGAQNTKGIPYGQYVEFWRKHAFLYPAMDDNRDQVKEMVADAIRKAVRKHDQS